MYHYSALKNTEILIPATIWINLEDIMLSKISQTQRTHSVWFHLYEVPRIEKFMETESRVPGTKMLCHRRALRRLALL